MSAGAELSRRLGKNGCTRRPVRCTFLDAATYRDARAKRGITQPGLGSHDMRDSRRPVFVISMKMHQKRGQREQLQQRPVASTVSTRLSSLQFHCVLPRYRSVDCRLCRCNAIQLVTARWRDRSPRSRAREHMPAIALDRHRHFLDRAAFG